MKKIFTLASLFMVSLASQAQWTLQNTGLPSGTAIHDVNIVSPQVAWAVADDNLGNSQAFTRTANGGTTWTAGTITDTGISDYTPSNVSAINADTAWVSMYGPVIGMGRVYRTTDGGTTWTRQLTTGFTNPVSFLNYVHFFDANNGLAIGDPIGGIHEAYTTSDGGLTWTQLTSTNLPAALAADEYGVINMYSAHGNNFWFGTVYGRVFRTTDMGQTWTVATTGLTGTSLSHAMHDIEFTDANNGLIRRSSTIVKTTDGGLTWSAVPYTGTLYTTDISGVPTTTDTWVSVGNGSSYTLDQGSTWNTINTGTTYNHVSFYNPTTGWAGGITGTGGTGGIYKWSGPALFSSQDASVTSVTSPSSTICATSNQSICVVLSNEGLTPISNFAVTYQVDAGTAVTETFTGTIQPGATAPFCFTTEHAFTMPGAYTLTITTGLTDDDDTTNDEFSQVITSNALIGFTSSQDITICDGQSTTLVASGADTYTWMPGNILTASANVTPATTTTYTVTGANTAGCTVEEEVTVTVVPTVPIDVTSTAGTICSGESVTFNATGADSYSWSNGATGNSVTLSPNANTTLIVTGTIGSSCSNSDTITVTVNQSPVNPIVDPTLSVCTGNTLTLEAAGLAADTYTWTGPVGFFNTNQNATINNVGPNRAGIYTVTVNNANNCSTTGMVLVSVANSPVMSISNSGPICSGQNATITTQGATTYSWSTGQTTSDIVVSPTATTTYTVYGSNGNACTTMKTTTVEVLQAPQLPNLPTTMSVCAGETLELNPGGAAGNYNWTGPAAFTSNDASPVITNVTGANSGVYQLSMSDGGCVSGPLNINVTVTPQPNATFTFTNNGSSYTFDPVATGATYTWTFDNGSPATSTDENPTVNFSNNGSFVVTLVVNNNGCESTSSTTIMVSGVSEQLSNLVTVYPNPTQGKLFIDLSRIADQKAQLTIYNSLGQAVSAQTVNTGTVAQAELFNLAAGAYVVHIQTKEGILVKQILLQK